MFCLNAIKVKYLSIESFLASYFFALYTYHKVIVDSMCALNTAAASAESVYELK